MAADGVQYIQSENGLGVFETGNIKIKIVCKKVLTKANSRCYNSTLSKQNAQAYDAVRLHTNILHEI